MAEGKFDSETSFFKNKTHGRPMVLWKQTIESHISVQRQISTSFQPGSPPSRQCGVHLTTTGKTS